MSMSKNVAHTSARGVEPYDKCFGVGVHKKLESGGFSPYPRIERIREMYKTSPLFLDSGRALAFTAAFEEEIPGASAVECGNYLEHDLPGARRAAAALAAVLQSWTPARLAYENNR